MEVGKIEFVGDFVLLKEFDTYVRLSAINELKYEIIGNLLRLDFSTSSTTYSIEIHCIDEYDKRMDFDTSAIGATRYSSVVAKINSEVEEKCFEIIKKFIDKK